MSPITIKYARELIDAHGSGAALALLLFSFCIPLAPKLLPFLFLVSFVLTVIDHRKERYSDRGKLKATHVMLWMGLLYLLYLTGMAWSRNMDYGRFDLEVKSTMIFLPILYYFIPMQERRGGQALLRAFMWGAVVAVVWLLVMAMIHAVSGYDDPASGAWHLHFYASGFSPHIHPSYLAMYLTVALLIWFMDRSRPASRFLAFSIPALLCLGIVLCGSRIGWLLLGMVLFLLMRAKRKVATDKQVLKGLIFIASIGVGLLVAGSEYARQRVVEMFRSVEQEGDADDPVTSSGVRVIIWEVATDLIGEQWLFGTGTGDVKDALLKSYKERGYGHAKDLRLNAHSQFLQTTLTLGMIGLLLIVLMFLLPGLHAYHARDVLLLLFLFVIAVNWSVESMLETQAGVMFFTWASFALSMRNTNAK